MYFSLIDLEGERDEGRDSRTGQGEGEQRKWGKLRQSSADGAEAKGKWGKRGLGVGRG